MSDQSWRLIEHVFNTAIELPAAKRAGYLDSACLDDKVRAEVESLITAEEESKNFFEKSIAEAAREAAEDQEQEKTTDENRLGDYRLVEPSGASDVYVAELAEDPRQPRVTIHILHGRASGAVLERLTLARRGLERLDHPQIARLLGGGESPDGVQYVVAELVEGEPIDRFCEGRALPLRTRVELFREVCRTVHHAHKQLVLHRDLKPRNIFVTGDGGVKLLGCGIATLRETLEPESRRMTPEFASPEQIRGDALSTASDVYSLGAVLYKLLSGRPPYELGSSSTLEIERIVCELEPPPPSAVAGAAAGELLGDLDSIVQEAMSKAPEQRHGSAEKLADDLGLWLDGCPVGARDDGWRGHAARHVLTQRAITVAAALTALLMAAFAIWSAMAANRIQAKLDLTEKALQQAGGVSTFLSGIYSAADPREARGDAVTAREVLDWGAERAMREAPGDPLLQADRLSALSDAYRNLGLYRQAHALASVALSRRTAALGERHAEVAASLVRVGRVEQLQGNVDQAEKRFRSALEMDRSAIHVLPLAVAADLDALAALLRDQGNYGEAETAAREALQLRSQGAAGGHPAAADSFYILGTILERQERYVEADEMLRSALEIDRRVKGDLHPDTAAAMAEMGTLLRKAGQLGEAEEALGKALSATLELYGERHPAAADTLRSLAEVLRKRGRPNEAREMLQVALDVDRTALRPGRREVAADLAALGRLAYEAGEAEEAETCFAEAEHILLEASNAEHAAPVERRSALEALILVYEGWGRSEDAMQIRAKLGQ